MANYYTASNIFKASRKECGLSRIRALLRQRFFYNRDKNRDNDDKAGQPEPADLLINILFSLTTGELL